jgi:sugar (pentulose or hexulose) kinase
VDNLRSFHIAIDVGSTSIKGARLDLLANELNTITTLPFPVPCSDVPPEWFVIDPRLVVSSVKQLIQRLSEGCEGVGHIWLCGQMGGVILADKLGNALSRYISWRDQRSLAISANGKSHLHNLREAWPEDVWMSLGRELQPGSTSTILSWLQQKDRLPADAIPCSIADYVVANLARKSPTMHVTYAIGLLDLHTMDWHRQALAQIGLDKVHWPKLIHGIEPIIDLQVDGQNYLVHGCFGDHQTALWGAGLEREELSINASTGSQVSQRTNQFVPGPYQTRLYFEGDMLNTVTHLPAGRALNALVSLLTEFSQAEGQVLNRVWDNIAHKMAAISDTEVAANINFYACPLGANGSLSNLTVENLTVGNLFLAACKAMSENYFSVAQRLAPSPSFRSLVLSGGLAQSLPRLADLIRKRFSMPLREVHGEDTLLGLLKLARHFSAPSSTCS